jgi:tetratricopeptide (TPR) repeat protein
MYKTVLHFFALISVVHSSTDSIIDSAVALAENRHTSFSYIIDAEHMLKNVLTHEPANVRALCELSSAYYLIGEHEINVNRRIAYYDSGESVSKQAIGLDSANVWAHYWYAANRGSIGQVKGIMNCLAIIPDLKNEYAIMERLAPTNAIILEALGAFYSALPGIIGGSNDKSLSYLRKALQYDPNYTATYFDIAAILIKQGNYSEARKTLQGMLNIKNPTLIADFVLSDKLNALRLLKEIEGE